jgi:leucyl aminopeptidase
MSLPELHASADDLSTLEVDVLVVGVSKAEEALTLSYPHLSPELTEALLSGAKAVGFKGGVNQSVKIPAPMGMRCTTVMFTGLGGNTPTPDIIRQAAGFAALNMGVCTSVGFALSDQPDLVHASAEGALLGAHRLVAWGREAEHTLTTIAVAGALSPTDIKRITAHAAAVGRVRDLVALPPNVLYPESFVERITGLAQALPIKIEVLDEVALKEGGFGGLTAVGQGSIHPPRLMVLRYQPKNATHHVALVGKGITFDSGGLSLKPANSMVGMKYDMTGAAVVSSVALASAELGLSVAVTAWVCLAENMPSGSASRPNDVITIKGGTTVEILNTDAEGRLVLADGLSSASAENPDLMIDVATLTGAARVALGERYAGLMGDPSAVASVEAAAKQAGELVWAMPLPEELRSLLDTDAADIANAKPGNALGGMLLAGLFLKEFVGKREDGTEIPWAHLDIAGPAENSSGAWGYTPKGPTGALVRTLLHLVEAPSLFLK